jgi:hypothetical protein
MVAAAGSAQKVQKLTANHQNLQTYRTMTNNEVAKFNKEKVGKLPRLMRKQEMATTAHKINRRVQSNGILYLRPEGTLFGGWDIMDGGSGLRRTTVVVPPFTDLAYQNRCLESATWSVNGTDASDNVVDGTYVDSYYRGETSQGYTLYYCPTVTTASGEYTLGEYNVYLKRNIQYSGLGLARVDSMTCLYNADPDAAELYEGNYYSPSQAWGDLDTDNVFGTGSVPVSGSELVKVTAAMQIYEKPASPLFITKLIADGVTTSQPIPEGVQMTALITGVKQEEHTYSDGTTGIVKTADLDRVLATMYASSKDIIGFTNDDNYKGTRNGKEIFYGYVVFQKPGEVDILGNEMPGNIVIDEEFAVVLQGFEQEGVDLGINGTLVEEYDDNTIQKGYNICEDGSRYTFTSHIALSVVLYGMYDMAYAPKVPNMYTFENENLDYRVVRVPATGSAEEYGLSNCTEGATACALVTGNVEDAGYPGVPVFTNVSWFDDNDNANYFVYELPEWIQNISVDPTFGYGMNLLMFRADPLPAGETGRWAVVNVYGQEAEMNGEYKYSAVSEPIIILQGDATIADVTGIQAIKGDKKTTHSSAIYNLAGQRVANGYKGLVIKNGKKYVIK